MMMLNPGCCCPDPCSITVPVSWSCGPSSGLPIADATVILRATSAGPALVTTTTDGLGIATIALPGGAAGNYWIEVSHPDAVTVGTSAVRNCGGIYTTAMTPNTMRVYAKNCFVGRNPVPGLAVTYSGPGGVSGTATTDAAGSWLLRVGATSGAVSVSYSGSSDGCYLPRSTSVNITVPNLCGGVWGGTHVISHDLNVCDPCTFSALAAEAPEAESLATADAAYASEDSLELIPISESLPLLKRARECRFKVTNCGCRYGRCSRLDREVSPADCIRCLRNGDDRAGEPQELVA